jgi:hypothetical protein
MKVNFGQKELGVMPDNKRPSFPCHLTLSLSVILTNFIVTLLEFLRGVYILLFI